MIDDMGAWFGRVGDRLADYGRLVSRPEVAVGLAIAVLWALLAGTIGNVWFIVFLLALTVTLHLQTVRSGSNVLLWMMTTLLVLMAIGGYGEVLADRALFLTFAAVTIVVYLESVRWAHHRRRRASVDQAVLSMSLTAVAVVAAASVISAGVAVALSEQEEEWSWLWMPAAAFTLFAIGLAFTLLPPWRARGLSSSRWRPGERIPPQPIGLDEQQERINPRL